MSLIVILGPTAVGKTELAVHVAKNIEGEVLSADSRQVYRNMDIGTGKDLAEYNVDGYLIPYHLIDIKNAGEVYNVFDFQQDFYKAYQSILGRRKVPILCGGTGLYLEAALAKEKMIEVTENSSLRKNLKKLNQKELVIKLQELTEHLHNQTDTEDRERTIRAIEIAEWKAQGAERQKSPVEDSILIGIRMEREKLRLRIAERLDSRLKEGMIEEVESLLNQGISHEQLNYYGLEYRFISQYLKGELSYQEMYNLLVQAIRRFAKKQMTWYRRMEKKGQYIHWINAEDTFENKLKQALNIINKQ